MALVMLMSTAGNASAVSVGNFTISPEAAVFTDISTRACEMRDEMLDALNQGEPVDWDAVNELYEAPLMNMTQSLKDLAQGAIFNNALWGLLDSDSTPEVWEEFQDAFGDDAWLDTAVRCHHDITTSSTGLMSRTVVHVCLCVCVCSDHRPAEIISAASYSTCPPVFRKTCIVEMENRSPAL